MEMLASQFYRNIEEMLMLVDFTKKILNLIKKIKHDKLIRLLFIL